MHGLTRCSSGQYDGFALGPPRSRSGSRSGSPACRLSAWVGPVEARTPFGRSELTPPRCKPLLGRPHERRVSGNRSTFVKFVHFDTPPSADKAVCGEVGASDPGIIVSDEAAEASPPKVITAESLGLHPPERLAAAEPAPARMVSRGRELRGSSSAPELPSGHVLPETSLVPELRVGCGLAHDDSAVSAQKATSDDYLHPSVGIPSVDLPGLCVEHALHGGGRNVSGGSTLTAGGGSQSALVGNGGDGAHSAAEAVPKDAYLADVPGEAVRAGSTSVDSGLQIQRRLDPMADPVLLTASPAVAPVKEARTSIEQVPADAGGGPA